MQICSSQFNHPSELFHILLFKYSMFYISSNAAHLPSNDTLREGKLLLTEGEITREELLLG